MKVGDEVEVMEVTKKERDRREEKGIIINGDVIVM